jgi:hypothetical protein
MKTMLSGLICLILGFGFWYLLLGRTSVGNPLTDWALLRHGRTVSGLIVDAEEDVGDGPNGRAVWSNGLQYTYQIPDGRKFTASQDFSGRLPKELEIPTAVEVEYLPENPQISRIKGTGSESVWHYIPRVAVNLGLLALCLLPGASILNEYYLKVRVASRGTQ